MSGYIKSGGVTSARITRMGLVLTEDSGFMKCSQWYSGLMAGIAAALLPEDISQFVVESQ